MEKIKESLPLLKAVKKVTYNSIITQSHINPCHSPLKLKGSYRSQSFKKITNFVPKLKPKKSTFVPTPLKLNTQKKQISEKEEDDEKQMTGDEIKIINSSSSSISSSEINLSDDDSENKIKENKKFSPEINAKFESDLKENNDDSDSFYLDEVKNINANENIKILRKKMCHIKIRIGSNKFKETEEVIHEEFRNNFDIGLKKYKKEKEINLYSSVKYFENKENIKPKGRSIFQVISTGNRKK
jgi:hypothetical protein